jgi:hypothetical protein
MLGDSSEDSAMYGSNRTVSYPLVDNLPAGAIGWKTMGSDWIGSKSFDQTKSARVIEREALNAGLPAEIAAAMLVNAMAESYLDPKVKGDLMDAKKRFPNQKGFDPSTARYRSIGLFQLYETGVGKGSPWAALVQTTATSTRSRRGNEGFEISDTSRTCSPSTSKALAGAATLTESSRAVGTKGA